MVPGLFDPACFFTKITLKRRYNMIRELTKQYMMNPTAITMASGMPNTDTFPYKEISFSFKNGSEGRLEGKELATALQYGPSQGYPPLVDMWREYQRKWHSPKNDVWDLCFTTGSQDGCSKLLEMFIEPGDPILVQAPTYTGILAAIAPLDPLFIGIPQDKDGIIPSEVDRVCMKRFTAGSPMPKILYVNPTGANPTGSNLSEDRRRDIYKLAQKYNFLIIEDDAYYFVTFLDKRPSSFLSLDVDGRVIRLDSFSKILSSGMRLGSVTCHKEILAKLVLHTESSNLHTSSLSQMLLYKLLKSWGQEGLEEHFAKVQAFYKDKRDMMLGALKTHFHGLAAWSEPQAGMFVWVTVTAMSNAFDVVTKKCVPNGVFVLPGNAFNYDATAPDQHLRLCYSYASPDEINKGLSIIAAIIREDMKEVTNKVEPQ